MAAIALSPVESFTELVVLEVAVVSNSVDEPPVLIVVISA